MGSQDDRFFPSRARMSHPPHSQPLARSSGGPHLGGASSSPTSKPMLPTYPAPSPTRNSPDLRSLSWSPPCSPGAMPLIKGAHGAEQEMLARWLEAAERERTTAPAAPSMLWTNLYSTPSYAYLWYSARTAGEQLRALALQRLYTARNQPGGVYPDPREPGAFSSQAVLKVAAQQANLRICQLVPNAAEQPHASSADDALPTGNRSSLAWIQLYGLGQLPDIMVRPTRHLQRRSFEIAMCLGMVWKEAGRYRDPSAPAGAITLPTDQPLVSVLHQFAIALLAGERDCPAEWPCACNALRRRYNAAPPDHPQATDVFAAQALKAEIARQQQASAQGQYAAPDTVSTPRDPRLYTGRLELPDDPQDDEE